MLPKSQSESSNVVSKPGRRSYQVKVTLNADELERLDQLVDEAKTDRASVLRMLLNNQTQLAAHENRPAPIVQSIQKSNDNKEPTKPVVAVFEPREFADVSPIVMALLDGTTVNLNLTQMAPDAAQRTVDFVAGGTFAISGQQERVGEGIFCFTPPSVKLDRWDGSDIKKAYVTEHTDVLKDNAVDPGHLLSEPVSGEDEQASN